EQLRDRLQFNTEDSLARPHRHSLTEGVEDVGPKLAIELRHVANSPAGCPPDRAPPRTLAGLVSSVSGNPCCTSLGRWRAGFLTHVSVCLRSEKFGANHTVTNLPSEISFD